jgi:hypothetical protein
MSSRTPSEPGGSILAEDYWDKGGRISEMLLAALGRTPSAESISHHTDGFTDCLVRTGPVADPAAERDLMERETKPGRRLIVRMQDFDGSMARLNTGELMRMVVQTSAGGYYVGRVKKRLHLVGKTRPGAEVTELDRQMNLLVTEIRNAVFRLQSEQVGGRLMGDPEPLPEPEPHLFFRDLRTTGQTPAGRTSALQASAQRWEALWRAHVNTADLQYAAYYRGWEAICQGDVFNARPLGDRFLDIAATARRALYGDLARRLRADVARLRGALGPLADADLTRLVLDVQEGAVYIHWLDSRRGDFLLGVTLDQPMVDRAERRLRALVERVRNVREYDWEGGVVGTDSGAGSR